MANEVVKIRRDRVEYRVPGFQNFGSRMDELESEQLRRVLGDPEHPKKLGEAVQGLAKTLDTAHRDAKKALEANRKKTPEMTNLFESAMAAMLQQLGESLKDAELELDKLDAATNDEVVKEVVARPKPARNRELLEVLLADNQKWSDDVRANVDKFLDKWPTLRPKILKAVFDAYRNAYDDIWAFVGGEPYDKITLPDPTSPNAIEELFYLDGIHLDEKNQVIGLTGCCTWEDEHGLGVRLKNGKVVEVGYADVVYQ